MNQLTAYQKLKVRVQLVRDSPIKSLPAIKIESSHDVYNLLKDDVLTWDREKFLSIMLSSRNHVIGIDEVSIGTMNSTLVHPREVFKSAILANAHAVIFVHNHPSEDCEPSEEDKKITEQLHEASKILNILMYDHIIIAKNGFSSWAEQWALHTAQN